MGTGAKRRSPAPAESSPPRCASRGDHVEELPSPHGEEGNGTSPRPTDTMIDQVTSATPNPHSVEDNCEHHDDPCVEQQEVPLIDGEDPLLEDEPPAPRVATRKVDVAPPKQPKTPPPKTSAPQAPAPKPHVAKYTDVVCRDWCRGRCNRENCRFTHGTVANPRPLRRPLATKPLTEGPSAPPQPFANAVKIAAGEERLVALVTGCVEAVLRRRESQPPESDAQRLYRVELKQKLEAAEATNKQLRTELETAKQQKNTSNEHSKQAKQLAEQLKHANAQIQELRNSQKEAEDKWKSQSAAIAKERDTAIQLAARQTAELLDWRKTRDRQDEQTKQTTAGLQEEIAKLKRQVKSFEHDVETLKASEDKFAQQFATAEAELIAWKRSAEERERNIRLEVHTAMKQQMEAREISIRQELSTPKISDDTHIQPISGRSVPGGEILVEMEQLRNALQHANANVESARAETAAERDIAQHESARLRQQCDDLQLKLATLTAQQSNLCSLPPHSLSGPVGDQASDRADAKLMSEVEQLRKSVQKLGEDKQFLKKITQDQAARITELSAITEGLHAQLNTQWNAVSRSISEKRQESAGREGSPDPTAIAKEWDEWSRHEEAIALTRELYHSCMFGEDANGPANFLSCHSAIEQIHAKFIEIGKPVPDDVRPLVSEVVERRERWVVDMEKSSKKILRDMGSVVRELVDGSLVLGPDDDGEADIAWQSFFDTPSKTTFAAWKKHAQLAKRARQSAGTAGSPRGKQKHEADSTAAASEKSGRVGE